VSTKKHAVKVMIGGEEYTVRSDLPPEYTREVAAYVDQALKKVLAQGPIVETHKAAILAALDITNELFQAKKGEREVAARLAALADDLTKLLPPGKRKALPVEHGRHAFAYVFEGSGTFGRSCYEDAAQAAAVMSQAVGKPVRVQFMRSDELGWDDYGPAHLADVRAGIDANGNLVAYEYHGWQHGWVVNETTHELALRTPPKERTAGAGSIPVNRMSTGSMYTVSNRRVVSHAVPMVGYLKGAPLRSPLDLSFAFASEQTIDELATAAKMDPLEFRRRNIGDARWLGVLNAAADAAKWQPRLAAAALSKDEVVRGRGIGLGTHHVSYGAAVADIEVNTRTGNIVATRLFGALDAGLIVNPALVENQIIGQMIQATSRTLKEEVTFDKTGVTSLDWVSYPVLRFAEHPHVTPVVVQRLDEPSTGAGEEVMGATAAAIANAFFDATGVRLRQYPMTPERVKAALAART